MSDRGTMRVVNYLTAAAALAVVIRIGGCHARNL